MQLVDYAKDAIRELGMEPNTDPIRGGADGAQLSFRDFLQLNLGTGGYASTALMSISQQRNGYSRSCDAEFKEICAVTKRM